MKQIDTKRVESLDLTPVKKEVTTRNLYRALAGCGTDRLKTSAPHSSLFNKDLSFDTNFNQIYLAEQYF